MWRASRSASKRICAERRATTSVPEEFIRRADEIVIVDVPAEDVAPDRSNLAPAQLNDLRELALLLAAQVVEDQLQRFMDSHHVRAKLGNAGAHPGLRHAPLVGESDAQKVARALPLDFHGQLL
jgi:hypothetical protein